MLQKEGKLHSVGLLQEVWTHSLSKEYPSGSVQRDLLAWKGVVVGDGEWWWVVVGGGGWGCWCGVGGVGGWVGVGAGPQLKSTLEEFVQFHSRARRGSTRIINSLRGNGETHKNVDFAKTLKSFIS